MAVKTKAAIQNLQSKLQATGRFVAVLIGEPTAPPEARTAAIFMSRYENAATTLAKTVERRIITVRFYHTAFAEPLGDVEFWLDDAVTEFLEDVWGDFDLGATIRNPEPLGVTVICGYQQIGNVWYRIADITLPLIVDDSATFSQ